jgi:hypothetical protein
LDFGAEQVELPSDQLGNDIDQLTAERAQLSSSRLKSSGNSQRSTRPAAHSGAVLPSTKPRKMQIRSGLRF